MKFSPNWRHTSVNCRFKKLPIFQQKYSRLQPKLLPLTKIGHRSGLISQIENALREPKITPSTPVCNYLCVVFSSWCHWAFSVLDKRQQRCSVWVPLFLKLQSRSSNKRGNERYESLSEGNLVEKKMEKTKLVLNLKIILNFPGSKNEPAASTTKAPAAKNLQIDGDFR